MHFYDFVNDAILSFCSPSATESTLRVVLAQTGMSLFSHKIVVMHVGTLVVSNFRKGHKSSLYQLILDLLRNKVGNARLPTSFIKEMCIQH